MKTKVNTSRKWYMSIEIKYCCTEIIILRTNKYQITMQIDRGMGYITVNSMKGMLYGLKNTAEKK